MKSIIIKSSLVTIIILLFLVDGTIRFLTWQHQTRYPTTSQAIIKANPIPIYSKIDGKISVLRVNNSTYVNRGDILFEVDSLVYKTALAKAQQDLADIKAQVKVQQNQVNLAEKLVEDRQAELSQVSKSALQESGDPNSSAALSPQVKTIKEQLELAQKQLENAYLNLGKQGVALAKIKVAEGGLAKAQVNFDYSYVAAPTNGIVNNLHLKIGSPVNVQNELFTIIENNEWWVNATFNPRDLKRIHPDQPALIKLPLYPQHSFSGIVENINANLVKIKILDPTANFPLKVDQNCQVIIDTKKPKIS